MIIFNGKNSKTDFDLYIASVERSPATRKVITETVPYMSGLWDFSYHDGEIDEYEPAKVKYTFDVIADSKKELNALRKVLIAWVHSRGENKLIDTNISDTAYYNVYQAQASWSEEGLQGLLTAEFTCYPFMLTEKSTELLELTTEVQSLTLNNEGNRIIEPIIKVESKNIIDLSTFEIGKKLQCSGAGNTAFTVNDTNNAVIMYIPVSANTSYTFSLDNTNYTINRLIEFDANKVCIKYLQFFQSNADHSTYSWKTAKTTNYIAICLNNKNGTDVTAEDLAAINLQIERGTTATEYKEFAAAATISDGVNSYSFNAGKHKGTMTLKAGENAFTISGEGLLSVAYTEEAL